VFKPDFSPCGICGIPTAQSRDASIDSHCLVPGVLQGSLSLGSYECSLLIMIATYDTDDHSTQIADMVHHGRQLSQDGKCTTEVAPNIMADQRRRLSWREMREDEA